MSARSGTDGCANLVGRPQPNATRRSIDDAFAVIRERGFRLTASRRLALESLFAADADEKPVCLTKSFEEVRDDDEPRPAS
jgi:hypothetical protein